MKKKNNLLFPQLFYVISLVSILLTMGTGFSFAQNVQNDKISKDIQSQQIWDKKEWKEWKDWKEIVEKVENKWEKNETQEGWDNKTVVVDENSKIEEKNKDTKTQQTPTNDNTTDIPQTPKNKNEAIENLLKDKLVEEIQSKEKQIKDLQNQLAILQLQQQNKNQVEQKVQQEIQKIKESIDNNTKLGSLEKENELLVEKLKEKEKILDNLKNVNLDNKIQEEEILSLISLNKTLKENLENKLFNERLQKWILIFWSVIISFVILFLFKFIKKFIAKKLQNNKEKRNNFFTLCDIISSLLVTSIWLYDIWLLIQIFHDFFYIIIFTLGSIVVAFKSYLQSFIIFITMIAFKTRVGSYVKIDNKLWKIKKLWTFYVKIQLLWEDLSHLGEKNYLNSDFIEKANLVNTKEIWVLHNVSYKINLEKHTEDVLLLIETLLNGAKKTSTNVILSDKESNEEQIEDLINLNAVLIDYNYNLSKSWNELELSIQLRSLKWKNREVLKLIREIEIIIKTNQNGN